MSETQSPQTETIEAFEALEFTLPPHAITVDVDTLEEVYGHSLHAESSQRAAWLSGALRARQGRQLTDREVGIVTDAITTLDDDRLTVSMTTVRYQLETNVESGALDGADAVIATQLVKVLTAEIESASVHTQDPAAIDGLVLGLQ